MRNKEWTIQIALVLALLPAGCGKDKAMNEAAGRQDKPPESAAHGAENHPGEHEEAGEGVLAVDAEVLRDLKLTTFAAELRPGGEGVTALGELKVNEQAYAEVGAPIAGRVIRLAAAPGQFVRRGQALAELRSVELGQARAGQIAARARLELARKTAERKRGLAAERIVSRGELQRAEADLAEAEADSQASAAGVSALGVGSGTGRGDLSGFALLSPISGTVLERAAVQGQMADPSRPLFRIADLSRLWLVLQAPERDAVRVRVGSPAEIALAALPEQKLRGTVVWVGGEVDAHSRTVPVRIELPNHGGTAEAGDVRHRLYWHQRRGGEGGGCARHVPAEDGQPVGRLPAARRGPVRGAAGRARQGPGQRGGHRLGAEARGARRRRGGLRAPRRSGEEGRRRGAPS